jgi:hypothetical protein
VSRHDLKVYADYHTFYLMDDGVQPEIPTDVSTEDMKRRVKAEPHIVVVYPARNVEIPVTIEVHAAPPAAPDLAKWDHVAEASLAAPTGRIVVAGCSDYLPKCERIDVKPGEHRLRLSCGGLSTISDDGLDGQDHYQIDLWPAPAAGVKVLKQAPGPD